MSDHLGFSPLNSMIFEFGAFSTTFLNSILQHDHCNKCVTQIYDTRISLDMTDIMKADGDEEDDDDMM